MDTAAEQTPLKPKRRYKPRAVCTDPELKYRYKKKPGPKPGRGNRKRIEPVRTDAEQRRHSRAVAASKKGAPKRYPSWHHLLKYTELQSQNPAYTRRGIPDGMNRQQADEAWAKARAKAEEFYEQMVDKGIVAPVNPEDFERVTLLLKDGTTQEVLVPKTDDAKASVALKEAMVMAIGPLSNMDMKLKAINTVLKFTKSPPATKLEVSKSEDLLAAALADINTENGDQ